MNTLDAPETPDTSARASRSLKAALALGVVGFAAVGYWFTGTPDYAAASVQAQRAAQADASAAAASAPAMPDAAQIDTMIGKLEAHLKTEPGDLQGWTMLGRAQTLLGRMEQASVAYARAVALRSDDARLLADYAEALGMSQGQSLQGEPSKLIARALAIDAMQPKALALAGAAAFDSKDYAAAARLWVRCWAPARPMPSTRRNCVKASPRRANWASCRPRLRRHHQRKHHAALRPLAKWHQRSR